MRLIYLFLFSLFCLATAKYLPHERVEHRAHLWRNQRSVTEETDLSSESEDDDVDEENGDEKLKQDEDWRKYEEKIEKEKRKYQEKVEKEQRKLQEKIEKEKRKQEESKRKLQEKITKEEMKRQEKVKKQLEKMKKETFKNEKQQEIEEENNVNNKQEKSVKLENLLKSYVYEKYGLNSISTETEKEAAINRYFQEELALEPNSTKSEQRQTIIRFIQIKLLNDTSDNGLRNFLLDNLSVADKTNLEAKLTKKIENLESEAVLIKNLTLPWIESEQQQIEENRTLLQTFLQFINSVVPSWTGIQSPNTSGTSSASDNQNQNNENIALNLDATDSSTIATGSDVPSQSESAVSNPSQSSDNTNDNGLSNSGTSGSGSTADSNSPTTTTSDANAATGSANAVFPENEASLNAGNTDPSNSLASTDTGEVEPSVVTSISELADPNLPAVEEPASGSSGVSSNTGDGSLNEKGALDIVDSSNNSPVEPVRADTTMSANEGTNPESIDFVTKDSNSVSNGINESVSPDNEKTTNSIQEGSYLIDVVTDPTGSDTTNSEATNIEESSAVSNISGIGSNDDSKVSQEASNTLAGSSQSNIKEESADSIVAAPSTSDIVVSKPADGLPDVPVLSNTDIPVTEAVAAKGTEDPAATLTNVSSSNDNSLTSSSVDSNDPAVNTGKSSDVLLPSAESTVENNNDAYTSSHTVNSNSEGNTSPVTTDIAIPSDAVESQFVSTDSEPSVSETSFSSSSVKDQIHTDPLSIPQNNDASLVDSTSIVPISESTGSTNTVSDVSETENKLEVSNPVGIEQPTPNAWNNETVTNVKEIPVTEDLNMDIATIPTTNSNMSATDNLNNSSSTAASTTSDGVTIPEEAGATVVDIVPQ